MLRLCIACKGSRLLCGRKSCPILTAALKRRTEVGKIATTKEFFGPSTSIFVGRMGYPAVGVGPLTVMEEVEFGAEIGRLEEPSEWFAQGLDMEKIIDMRSATLRANRTENIASKSKFISDMSEIAMAECPTDIELVLRGKPSFKFSFSDIIQPTGASVKVEKMKVTENPKIPKKVERIVSDDIIAVEAANALYELGLDVYKVSAVLSSGALGLSRGKKMVPTRWSITATDDIIFKKLALQFKEYAPVDSFYVYESSYMDNHFQILLLPSLFEYENFEAWFPGSVWNTAEGQTPVILEDYEGFNGRRRYAADEGGGYYAARLAVAEALQKMRRQAGVVVFREIQPSYSIPLGVWVVRETVRDAFRNGGAKFDTREEALEYITSRLQLQQGLKIKIGNFKSRSKILRQRRLEDFW